MRHFLSKMLNGCSVCVICNSSSFHSFIFKLCIMIVYTLDMCTQYLCTFDDIFGSVELRHYYIYNPFGMLKLCKLYVNCKSKTFHSFIFKL